MADTDLCVLSDVEKHLNQVNKTTNEIQEVLSNLITNKTQAITTFLGFEQILAQDYTEYMDGDGDSNIYPNNTPINSITSINIDSDWTWGTSTLISSDYYRIVDSRYITMKGYFFTTGSQNVQLIYNAGYTTIPSDLKQVCIDEVVRAYNEKSNIGISSKTNANGSITRFEKGFMKQSLEVLYRYKKIMAY